MTRSQAVFVWVGGALFAASLAVTAHAFAVTWAEPRPLADEWLGPLALDATLLTAFALHHSLFARDRIKTWTARFVPPHLVRSVYVWMASLLLIGVVWSWQPIGGELYRLGGWMAWALRTLQLAGLGLIAASVRAIDGLELAGIRPPRPGTSLYVNGPYGFVRHPLYLGWILIVASTPYMTGDRLAFATLTTAYLVVAMPWEERSLISAYGHAYRQYVHQVRWRVVPHVY